MCLFIVVCLFMLALQIVNVLYFFADINYVFSFMYVIL